MSVMGFAWFLAIILAMGASVVGAAPSAAAVADVAAITGVATVLQQQTNGPLAPPIVFVILMLLLFGAVIGFSLMARRDAKR
ncbi:MAG: hypothetical protein HC822_09630 [Oscillochloris sp.]|nr:hypothetical protein [Oscillochloris sp.]